MDWNKDPELKKIRNEFIQSFPERLKQIQEIRMRNDWEKAKLAVHKIAGVAHTYGFKFLSEVCGQVEDFLTVAPIDEVQVKWNDYLSLLEDVLTELIQKQSSSKVWKKDKRMKDLISVVEALDVEAKS